MKRILSVILVLITLSAVSVFAAYADSGPKPSYIFRFSGLTEKCYATFLTEENSDMSWMLEKSDLLYDKTGAKRKFLSYKDSDGWRPLNEESVLSPDDTTDDGKYCCLTGLYLPDEFKLLLYYPDSDVFASSEKLTKYAFNCSFNVTVKNNMIVSVSHESSFVAGNGSITAGLSFLLLFVITIVAELLVGVAFGFRKRRQVWVIVFTNMVSLSIMSLLIVAVNPPIYGTLFSLPYALFEIGVAVAETVAYILLMPRATMPDRVKIPRIVAYTFAANLITYAISEFLPGLR